MQSTPYTVPVVVAALVCAAAGALVARRAPRAPTTRDYLVSTGCLALTALAYAGELASASLDAKLGWLALRYVGICPTPMMSLVLALRWAGHDRWLSPSRLAAIALVPAITLVLAWTNGAHHWVSSPSVLVARDGFSMRHAESGPAFWAFALHGYGCMAIVALIYTRALFQTRLRRRQGAALLAATLVPWALNFVYLAGLSPDPALDLSPFGYAASAVLLALGLLYGRLFELAPIARDRVLETLADAVVVIDERGRIVDWNPAAERLFGRGPDAIGTPLAALLGADTAERVLANELTREVSWLGRIYDVRAARVRSPTAHATVLTLRDVSAERETVAAREEALAMARSAASARAEFLARMSHEVRGPLHGVLGAADLLLASELTDAQRRYAGAITASAGSLLAIVDEILDHARLESDRVELEIDDVPLRPLLDEVARMFGAAAEKKRLALDVDADAALAVRADANRLRQVLVNLAGNAVKFTERGSIGLRASRDGALARIVVSDTGIGIPEHAHARIFEAFEVAGTARRVRAGTGLGLAIARRLVEAMGGAIAIESAPGRGTSFEVSLPAAAEGAGIEPARPAMRPPVSRDARVLVVDDDEVSRLVTHGLLAREGCTVELCESAEEALAAHERWRPDLVVTDVRMGGSDGLALAAELRDAGHATPVVALTGDVYDGARDAALRAGMREWLAKPVDPRRLREVLDAVLPARGAPAFDARVHALEAAGRARVMAAFHRSAPAEIAKIREHVQESRAELAAAAAHRLAGSAAVVGAPEIAATCAAIERSPRDRSLLEALEDAYARFERQETEHASAGVA